MNSYVRILLCLGFACGVLVGIDYLAPNRLSRLGLDAASLCELIGTSQSEGLRHDDLVTRDRYFLDNLDAKRLVVDEVFERRLTLREAAARFQAANTACPEYDWTGFRRRFLGRTDEERHCRQVLEAVGARLGPNLGPAEEVVTRLNAEFQETFGSNPAD